jgi:hypothetical protein
MARRIDVMDRDAQMYLRHKQNMPPEIIAVEFGVSVSTVSNGIRRAIRDQFRLSAEEERMTLQDQIDELMFQLRVLLGKKAYLIGASGKVATDPMTGEPLVDLNHPRQVMETMRKFMDMKAKLLGLNMPVKHRVEITGKMDEEIEQLAAQLAAHGAGTRIPLELTAGGADDGG